MKPVEDPELWKMERTGRIMKGPLYWIDRIFGHRWIRREELDHRFNIFSNITGKRYAAYRCAWCGEIKVKEDE